MTNQLCDHLDESDMFQTVFIAGLTNHTIYLIHLLNNAMIKTVS